MYVIVGGYFMDELFETIFFKALKADSTDIHFKLTDHLNIQFRVFGELQPYQEYEKTIGAKIMNYLKYKSFINVNYKMVPQTGAFHYFLHFPAPSLRGHKYITKLKSPKTLVCLSI